MKLETERKIKYWLGLFAKVLVVLFLASKLSQLFFGWPNISLADSLKDGEGETIVDSKQNDSLINVEEPRSLQSEKTTESVSMASETIVPKTASVYIYGEGSLERELTHHVSNEYFKGFRLQTSAAPVQSELLSGNLSSAANTELVCVGTVKCSYKVDQTKTSCELQLSFNTYNQLRGTKESSLSGTLIRYGIGFSEAQARANAIGKIHP